MEDLTMKDIEDIREKYKIDVRDDIDIFCDKVRELLFRMQGLNK